MRENSKEWSRHEHRKQHRPSVPSSPIHQKAYQGQYSIKSQVSKGNNIGIILYRIDLLEEPVSSLAASLKPQSVKRNPIEDHHHTSIYMYILDIDLKSFTFQHVLQQQQQQHFTTNKIQ
jgi:hypothetical protein